MHRYRANPHRSTIMYESIPCPYVSYTSSHTGERRSDKNPYMNTYKAKYSTNKINHLALSTLYPSPFFKKTDIRPPIYRTATPVASHIIQFTRGDRPRRGSQACHGQQHTDTYTKPPHRGKAVRRLESYAAGALRRRAGSGGRRRSGWSRPPSCRSRPRTSPRSWRGPSRTPGS